MGASFILTAVPDVKYRSDERLNRLSTLIANLSQDQLKTLREDCAMSFYDSDDDDIRNQVLEAIQEFWALDEYSDIHGSIHLPGCKLSYVFTGGQSWGEQPTDLSDTFEILSACEPVFNQMKTWAEEDLIQKFLDT